MRRRCLRPPLKRIPAGEWFCPSCASLLARPVPWAEELLGKQAAPRVITCVLGRSRRADSLALRPHVVTITDLASRWTFTGTATTGGTRPRCAGGSASPAEAPTRGSPAARSCTSSTTP